jgi:Rrf2 family transcriptional regulator, iron-sulfur cluster assembly transcription factor
MLFSRESEYAIQTLLYLAGQPEDSYTYIRKIAAELNIPFFYLSKILNKLVRAGFLQSARGLKGGIRYAKNPASISIYDVIVVTDGEDIFNRCALGLPACNSDQPCAVHNEWSTLREQFATLFKSKSLVEFSRIHLKK